MMMPEQRVIRNDIFQAERHLVRAEAEFGKSSAEYQDALRRFARLWSILRMTHSKEAFLSEITR
jgi:hypothetical protein